MSHDPDHIKEMVNYFAAAVAGLSVLQLVPWIASLFSATWLGINIWEKTTGKKFSDTWIARKLTRRN